MPRRHVVFAALLAVPTAAFYSGAASCCDADGIGTSAQPTVAAAGARPVPPRAASAAPTAPESRSDLAAAQPPPVTPGAAASGDDAGSVLGEGIGASAGTHRRGLRWQSFLPGVIK